MFIKSNFGRYFYTIKTQLFLYSYIVYIRNKLKTIFHTMRCSLYFFLFIGLSIQVSAQGIGSSAFSDGKKPNSIQTAMSFLLITPDAKAGAMGDAGVATTPDLYSMHWNPAKLSFLDGSSGGSLSYSPWLKNLVPDINFAYLTYFKKLADQGVLAGSVRYFSLGDIQLTDINQVDLGTYSPNEFAIDAAYSRKFGETFSLGTAIRYIRSSLSNGQFSASDVLRPASAFAADVSAYGTNPTTILGKVAQVSWGINFSNIGTKVSYAQGGSKYFLPTNLRLGLATSLAMNDLDKLTITLDLNKLLVPTSPELDANGKIIAGKDPNRSMVSGIFGSFSDAPGGFSEELREINYAMGAEYMFSNQFALRTGYFYENPAKGDRQFITVGGGFKTQKIGIDLAYILANQQKSPMANTLRFSLTYTLPSKN